MPLSLALSLDRSTWNFSHNHAHKFSTLHNITIEDLPCVFFVDASYSKRHSDCRRIAVWVIPTRKTALEQLCARYSQKAVIYFFRLQLAKINYPSKDMITSFTSLHPRSLDRQIAQIMEVDFPLTLTENEEQLPPLSIDRYSVLLLEKDKGLCLESMGLTND